MKNYRRTKRTGASGKKLEAPPDFAPVARTQRSGGAKAAVLRKRDAVIIRMNSNPYRGKVTSFGTATFTSEEGHPKTGRPSFISIYSLSIISCISPTIVFWKYSWTRTMLLTDASKSLAVPGVYSFMSSC